MARGHSPQSALIQKVPLFILTPLTPYTTSTSLRTVDPIKRFVDFSARTASMEIVYASLLFGRSPEFILIFLKNSNNAGFKSMTEEGIKRGTRLTSQLFPEKLSIFRKHLDEWINEVVEQKKNQYEKGKLPLKQAKRQITAVINRYNSIKTSAREVIGWLQKTYPEIYEQISKEDLEWLEKNLSPEEFQLG